MIKTITVEAVSAGLTEITDAISNVVSGSGGSGLCTLFIRHTSASLLVQENADPSARADLQQWLNRLVPENDPLYTHTLEGPDDMPAHIKSMLTQTSLSIPFDRGRLCLGTWQGVFLWEHRSAGGSRKITLHLMED